MLQSLLIKLAMLAATMSLVFWLGWQAPSVSSTSVGSGEGSPAVSAHTPVAVERDTGRLNQVTASPATGKFVAVPERDGGPAVRGLLDVNHANAKDFEALPGIGAVLAQRVIEYRTAVGRFQTIDELRSVKGIGPKIFERIKPLVTIARVGAKEKAVKRL